MANAVTHIILVIVLLDLFRHYVFGRHKFPRYLLVIGGIAGLGPDIDIPLSWVYSFFSGVPTDFHGVFTHSIIWVLLFLIVAVILQKLKNIKWAKIFYVTAVGWFMHLFLDCMFGGYKTFFWPINTITNFCPQFGIQSFAVSIDAIILVLWLIHEEVHNNIREYT